MFLSREIVVAAIFSCVVHIGALGLSATIMLTQGGDVTVPLKVVILQLAVSLPVGEKEARGANEPEPVTSSTSTPVPPPPPIKPEPKVKKPPRPLAPLLKKPPPPKVVTAPPPPEPRPQPEAFALPADNASTTDSVNQGVAGQASGATEAATGGNSDKMEAGARNEAGRGGIPGGTSARPAYGVNPKPPYPLIARRMGAQGIVLLRVHVRADGSVAEVTVAQSSGFSQLDDSALRTVRESWRFIPARLDGIPVESWVEVPIRFVLGNA